MAYDETDSQYEEEQQIPAVPEPTPESVEEPEPKPPSDFTSIAGLTEEDRDDLFGVDIADDLQDEEEEEEDDLSDLVSLSEEEQDELFGTDLEEDTPTHRVTRRVRLSSHARSLPPSTSLGGMR